MMKDIIHFVCWKYDGIPVKKKKNIFTSHHVNVLAAMIGRNMKDPYDITCITDDPEGIDTSRVKILPIWDDLSDTAGCYRRLKIFSLEMRDIIGKRIVSIDLDCVIKSDITSLFDRTEDFVIWGEHDRRAPYCGSFWMMKAGSRRYIWDEFSMSAIPLKYTAFGTDQGWINYKMYPKEAMWSKKDGIYNFMTHFCVHNFLRKGPNSAARKRWMVEMPSNAKIIFFNGRCDPSMRDLYSDFPWIEEHWRLDD